MGDTEHIKEDIRSPKNLIETKDESPVLENDKTDEIKIDNTPENEESVLVGIKHDADTNQKRNGKHSFEDANLDISFQYKEQIFEEIEEKQLDIGEEKESWEDDTSVFLDPYNCDLNLVIEENGLGASPFTKGGFSLMWSGVRANYGLLQGRAYYDCKIVKNLPIQSSEEEKGGKDHVLRVGWSTEESNFALGENKHSFGFGGTGKKSTEGVFSDYGTMFSEGDIVTSFLDYDGKTAKISFAVNGSYQSEAFIEEDFTGQALFPHIYVKNVSFSVNFGSESIKLPENFEITENWIPFSNITIENREHARKPPEKKDDCEVIMLIGLPGAGKSYLADKMMSEYPEKQYNILGTNLILQHMKVTGLGRKLNYQGRWDVLIESATICLNSLISVACKRRRNYILDQTNVYPSAQRRKMKSFEGFFRKALVVVPDDETLKCRFQKAEQEDGKEVASNAILDMKANFCIPKPNSEDPLSPFDLVEFAELNEDQSRELVQLYNQEGNENRFQNDFKRPRRDFQQDDSGYNQNAVVPGGFRQQFPNQNPRFRSHNPHFNQYVVQNPNLGGFYNPARNQYPHGTFIPRDARPYAQMNRYNNARTFHNGGQQTYQPRNRYPNQHNYQNHPQYPPPGGPNTALRGYGFNQDYNSNPYPMQYTGSYIDPSHSYQQAMTNPQYPYQNSIYQHPHMPQQQNANYGYVPPPPAPPEEPPSASQTDPAAAAVAAYAQYYASQGISGAQAGQAAAGTVPKLSLEEAMKAAEEYNKMQMLSQNQTSTSNYGSMPSTYYPRVGKP